MIKDLLSTLPSFRSLPINHQWRVTTTCGRLGIRIVGDLWDSSLASWRSWDIRIERLRDVPNWLKVATLEVLSKILPTRGVVEDFDQDWEWSEARSP